MRVRGRVMHPLIAIAVMLEPMQVLLVLLL